MTKIFHLREGYRLWREENSLRNKRIGLVPTMGALHQGHLALVKRALMANDFVVVSIFVNPTQFGNEEDLVKYPRTLNKDVALLSSVDQESIIVYAPEAIDIYEGNISSTSFDFGGVENEMEGKFLPGHFDGVGTIVSKLFEVVRPHNSYFGEKDFQQLTIIKKLVELIDSEVKVIGCPIYREADGLAMSSRNQRLTKEQRNAVPFIYEQLLVLKNRIGTKSVVSLLADYKESFERHPILELEYIEISDVEDLKPVTVLEENKSYRAFTAVFAGSIRLIDNIDLN